MNLEVMREKHQVKIVHSVPVWQHVLAAFSPLLIGSFLLAFYRNDRLSHWEIFAYVPGWVHLAIYMALATLWLWSFLRTLKEVNLDKMEWLFGAEEAHVTRHYSFGPRKITFAPIEVKEISLHARRLDGPDLFRLDIHLGNGQKLALPWTGLKGERDSLARQLSQIFIHAEIDWGAGQ